jgi:hypothetical protein
MLALVIPAHSMADYNDRSLDAEGCPGVTPSGREDLEDYAYPEQSLLDYPFVIIDWGDEKSEQSEQREKALKDFASSLVENPLFKDVGPSIMPVPSNGDPQKALRVATLADLKNARANADERLRKITLQIMLDVSGSTSRPPLAPLLRTREAFPVVKQILTTSDLLSLGEFSTVNGDTKTTSLSNPVARGDLDELIRKIAAHAGRGSDAPMSEMIRQAGSIIPPPGGVVAVITDGGPFNDEPDSDNPDKSIEKALAETPTVNALYILVLREGGCGGRFAPGDRAASAKRIVCAEAGQDVEESLRKMVFTVREWS